MEDATDETLCACGHDIWAHASYAGMGCETCEQCSGWTEAACSCTASNLFNKGCTCGAIERERATVLNKSC